METVNNNVIDEFAFLLEDDDNFEIKDDSVDLYSWCIKNGEYGKQILSEWSDRNLGNFGEKLNPRDVYDKDTRKYLWKCSICGNEYKSQLYKRLYNHRGCPYCAPAKWGRSHSVRAAESGKSIRNYCSEVSYGNVLLKEWDNVRNTEAGHTLDNTTYASNQMTYWICSNCGKEYEKMTYNRVRLNQGCPDCGRAGTSLPEQFIYWSFKQIDDRTRHRHKINGVEYDIYVPVMNLLIEYNGYYWHKDKEWKDLVKKDNSIRNGYRFMLIQGSTTAQEDIYSSDCIILRETLADYEKKLEKVIDYIIGIYGEQAYKIDYKLSMDEAVRHRYIPIENSVADERPELKKEFDEEKNGMYSLEALTCGSNKRIIWKCTSCGNNWTAKLAERALFKRGCPHCGFNIFDNKIHSRAIKHN